MKPAPIILATAAIAIGTWSLLNPTTQAAPKLLPFQGRLTDASGTVVPDGAKVVQFKIYDAPTGGTAVWNGEVQKLTVNSGLVSTLLGSKADLSGVDFNQTLYLEITIDANADSQITAADPPLLPRQSILPAVFAVEAQSARDSTKLLGFDWSALFDNGNPTTGKINAARLANGSITNAQLSPQTITGDRLVAGTINATHLDPNFATGMNPPGTILPYGGTVAPAGYLLCDGAEKLRTGTYGALFAAIGTSWGSSSGTAFNVPDLRGRFLRGVDGTAGNDPDKAIRIAVFTGGNTGNNVGSVQLDDVKNHNHSVAFLSATTGFGPGLNLSTPDTQQQRQDNAIFPSGGSPGAETRPKNAYVNYIIKY